MDWSLANKLIDLVEDCKRYEVVSMYLINFTTLSYLLNYLFIILSFIYTILVSKLALEKCLFDLI
jgi:hypothetical protein